MMQPGQKVFISYAHGDQSFAKKLAEDVRAAGASIWMDQLDIQTGELWDKAVGEALESAPRLLVILSATSVASQNVMDEVSFALEKGKQVLPVLYQDCEIPFRLRRFKYSDLRTDYDGELAQLIATLTDEPAPQTGSARPESVKNPPDVAAVSPPLPGRRRFPKTAMWSVGVAVVAMMAIVAWYNSTRQSANISPSPAINEGVNSPAVNSICVKAWNVLSDAEQLENVRFLKETDCKIIHDRGWLPGAGVKSRLCIQPWKALVAANMAKHGKTLVSNHCAIMTQSGWK